MTWLNGKSKAWQDCRYALGTRLDLNPPSCLRFALVVWYADLDRLLTRSKILPNLAVKLGTFHLSNEYGYV